MLKKIIISIITISLTVTVCYLFLVPNKMKYVEINKTNKALGIEKESLDKAFGNVSPVQETDTEIESQVNIALLGLDTENPNENGRSDAIMIATIDFENKKIKVSSIMRDLRVPIDNYGKDKINHAYSFGGPQLIIKTLNKNFGTRIRDYIAIDLSSLKSIVDILGGVTVNVEKNEMPFINEIVSDENVIKKSGMQLLNGEQAAAYVRNRDTGNGDFERTERQREVLFAMLKSVRAGGKASWPGYFQRILPYVHTSMKKTTILSLSLNCYRNDLTVFEGERFPRDGYWKSIEIAGIYYLQSDLDVMKKQMSNYIYNDEIRHDS